MASHAQLGQSPQLCREYRLRVYTETGSSHEKTTTVPLSTTQAACVWFILPCRVWPGEEHPSPLPEGAWDGIGRVIQGSLSSAVLCPCGEGSCWQLGAVLTRLGGTFGPSCPLAEPSRHFVPIPCHSLWECLLSQLKGLMN